MTLDVEAPQEIRCECSRSPLLAKAGIEDGVPFVWVRQMKASRMMTNVKFFGGRVEIECRECRRVWRIALGRSMKISKTW
jgi:hypothetical protein